MSLIRQPVPNLLGGVSQQSPAVRQNDQCETQNNCYPSPVDGLTKRQPTQHIKKMANALTGTARYHMINRAVDEQYLLEASTSSIKAHLVSPTAATGAKVAGDQISIVDTNSIGFGYLNTTGGATAKSALRFHTVADHTFVLNKLKVTAMDTGTITTAHAIATEAYIFVRQGNYATTYKVRIKLGGTEYQYGIKTFQGPGNTIGGSAAVPAVGITELNSIRTDDIAEQLKLGLNNVLGGVSSFTALRPGTSPNWIGSTIKITASVLATAIDVVDSVGDSTLSVVWKEVPAVTNYLPEICTHGFIVKVVGSAEVLQDNYYVKFIAAEGSGAFGKGKWQEDLNYSQPYQFDASTLPHVLVRQFDATGATATYIGPYFQWLQATWLPKLVGDTVIDPQPSFVGKLIQNLFYYKQRFGILADDRIVMSETNEAFNFWRTTNLVLEDTAPIDVTNNYTPPALSKSAIPYNENLILNSGRSQFLLRGGDILSPRTIQITPVSQFETYTALDPVPAGRSLFYGFKLGDHSGVREFYQVSENNNTFDSVDITAQIPNYIVGEIEYFAASTLQEIILCKATPDNILYLYKYIWQGNTKILSSWGTWTFASDAVVRYFMFMETTLYIAIEYPDGLYLEKIEVASGLADASQTYLTLIDRRTTNASVTGGTYNTTANTYTFTLPYTIDISQTPMVVQKITGIRYQVVSYTTTSITVRGNLTGINFYTGIKYVSTYEFTRPIAKVPQGRGLSPLSEAKQVTKKLWLEYHDSGAFTITVNTGTGFTYTYEVGGASADYDNTNTIDSVTLKTGDITIPIDGRSKDVVCQIVNDGPYPSNISSAVWDILTYSPYRSLSPYSQ